MKRKLAIHLVLIFFLNAFVSVDNSLAATVTATTDVPVANVCIQIVSDATSVEAKRLSGGDCVVQFKNAGSSVTWTVPSGVTSVQFLIVAGGGSGTRGICGVYWGQGGGGGEVLTGNLSVTPGSSESIVVGRGGMTTGNCSAAGSSGETSTVGSISARPGLPGTNSTSGNVGRLGGRSGNFYAGGIGTADGVNCTNGSCGTGGGGGAGGSGSGKNGGVGVSSSITGTSIGYGGGGAGKDGNSFGSAQDGGASGDDAIANRGGGGSDRCSGDCTRGGYGGSGIVVLRYTPFSLTQSETDTALSMSGAQFLSAVDETPFDLPTGNTFTLEAWVRPTNNSSNQILIGKDQQYSLYIFQNGSFGMNFYTTDSPSGVGGDVSIFRAGSVRLNEWQHVAVVRNGATVSGYVDGQLLSSFTFSNASGAIKSGSNSFVVGGYATNNQAYSGLLDQVRIWSSARTQSELQAGMNNFLPASQTNLIASYGFNESSGTRFFNNMTAASWNTDLNLTGGSVSSSQIAETSTVGAHSIVTFRRSYLTASGGWRIPSGVMRVSVLVVAGGGGAGFNSGGGGSGGGISFQPTLSVSDTRAVIVGQGGIGAAVNGTAADGFTSSFGSTSVSGGKGGVGPSGAGGASVSGSGAGGLGSGSSSTAGSSGANGPSYSISGTSVNYAGGGGGGGWIANTVGGAGGAGGGGAGGGGGASSRTGSNNGASGSPNTGGGGGGGSVSTSTSGNGGSGIVIVRWIIASAPIFTGPNFDTLTAGLSETFTVTGTPTSPLTRGYQWQVSTDTGTTWTNASTGSGFLTANYTTATLETTTSGIRYQYRVVITDSDTAGLSIVDTSTAVYLTINPRITISVDTTTVTQTYNQSTIKTFIIANGTGTRTTTVSPNNRSGITWSSVGSDSATLTIQPTLTVGTYYETITATDSVTASTSLALTITVDKARQATLSIGQYNAFVGVSSYPINVYGGSGTGAVTRSRTSEGTAGCTLTSGMFLSALRPGTCTVQAVKAGDTNYLAETATATIYWIQWSDAYATRAPSTPNEIVLNHSTAITKYNYDTLTVTSYQNSSGVTITSISTGAVLRIIGDGFSPTAAYTEVVFASMDAVDLTSGLQVVTSAGGNYLQLTIPSGATTGIITVNSPKGTAVGPSLTITP